VGNEIICFASDFFFIAETFDISKTEVNLLNLPDDPCIDTDVEVNIEECIKHGMEKRLNCTIPSLSSGEPLAPDGKPNNTLCSNNQQFMNYGEFFGSFPMESLATEADIAKEFGCIANCQEGIEREK